MYTIKDKTYAEAGYILNGNHAIGMWLDSTFAPFTERPLDLTNMEVTDDYIKFDIFSWRNPGIRTFADAKKFFIAKRYSNDDQLAIILNKDDDPLSFQKMQEWRGWSSLMAHKIMEILNETDR